MKLVLSKTYSKSFTTYALFAISLGLTTAGCSKEGAFRDEETNVNGMGGATFDPSSLDQLATEFLEEQRVPGLALAAVALREEGAKIWSAGYGVANIEKETELHRL